MNIILGASGQVGSAIVEFLIKEELPVRAVVRDEESAKKVRKKGVEVAIADFSDLKALKEAVKGGELIFLLTPETENSDDVLGDTKKILENYRKAIEGSEIKAIIGLSSVGAQYEKYEKNTGNLLMSNMLEHEFLCLAIHQVFIRPSYYYSNWLLSIDSVKENGKLPSFFPEDIQMNMNSPLDVAEFIVKKINNGIDRSELIELIGPKKYTPKNVAEEMTKVFGQHIEIMEITKDKWYEAMKEVGFSDNVVKNFIKMFEVVVNGNSNPEEKGKNRISLETTFKDYLSEINNE